MASVDDPAGRRVLGRVVVRSLTSWINLSVAGAASLGAAATQSWSIFALGTLAYGALIAWDLSSPAFWAKATKVPPRKLPRMGDLRDLELKRMVDTLTTGRERLDQILAETPEDVTRHLGTVMASLQGMTEGAARLVGRAEELARYLATVDVRPIRHEVEMLGRRAAAARDPVTKSEFERARATRLEQLRAIDDIAGARERVIANLSRMTATIEALPPQIVRMRALDEQALDQLSGQVTNELEHINDDMLAFEETLKSLGETTAP